MSTITINGVTIDPDAEQTALAAANLMAVDASGSNYILVQTKEPLGKETRAALGRLGVEVLEYVPDDTYVCAYPSTDLEQIRALPFVTWVNSYMRGFKISPRLIDESSRPVGTRRLLEVSTSPPSELSSNHKTVDVVLHADVEPESIRDKLASATGLDPSDLELQSHKLRVVVESRRLGDLADIDEVRHVEEAHSMQLHNNVARQVLNLPSPTNPGTGYEGAGQVVAVADTGFDKGTKTNVHDAFKGRVANLYPSPPRGKANDPDGHGTHVAGSILGDGDSPTLGHKIRGTAPAAKLVMQSLLDNAGGLGGLPSNLNSLLQVPYNNDGARIHSNSWGSIIGDGSYSSDSFEVDQFVWNNRDCLVCFSAGNEGVDRNSNGVVDLRSITPPGTAKNCLTVGASENDRPTFTLTYGQAFSYPAEPIASDRMANDTEGMVAFSGRGPTVDGRIKPDVVAPGSYILSARSRDTNSTGWSQSPDPNYYYLGGTSMATPLVAGCAALVREHLSTHHRLTDPSAALVKAVLINGARDLNGQYVPSECPGIPNHSEGFGRVDMVESLDTGTEVKDEATELDTGDEEVTLLTVEAGHRLKVTLVWTDPPGASLQNDLDLIVRAADGSERHGNMPPGSPQFDRSNNVEQVVWENPPAGDVEVIVRAHRVPRLPQSYALVTSLR